MASEIDEEYRNVSFEKTPDEPAEESVEAAAVHPTTSDKMRASTSTRIGSTASGGMRPSTSAKIQPSSSGNIRPSTSSRMQPTASGQIRPSISAKLQPTTSGRIQPSISGKLQPTASGRIRPSISDKVQPTASGQIRPSASVKLHPDASGGLHHSPSGQIQPTASGIVRTSTSGKLKPTASVIIHFSSSVEEKPTTNGANEPRSGGEVQSIYTGEIRTSSRYKGQPTTGAEIRSSPSGKMEPSASNMVLKVQPSTIGMISSRPSKIQATQRGTIGRTPSTRLMPSKSATFSTKSHASPTSSVTPSKPFGAVPSSTQRLLGKKGDVVLDKRTSPGRRTSLELDPKGKRSSADRRYSGGARGTLGSIISFRKHSLVDTDRARMGPRYLNTYRLQSRNPFNADRVNIILRNVVLPELEDARYDATTCVKLCLKMCHEIRYRVRLQGFDRYRIICKVDIGEKNKQGVCSALSFLWDGEKDNYTYVTFENMYLYAIAAVYGVYYD